jgi:hypothetical protein
MQPAPSGLSKPHFTAFIFGTSLIGEQYLPARSLSTKNSNSPQVLKLSSPLVSNDNSSGSDTFDPSGQRKHAAKDLAESKTKHFRCVLCFELLAIHETITV